MQLNAPKKTTWFIALALIAVALIFRFAGLSDVVAFWFACASAALMLLASYFTNL